MNEHDHYRGVALLQQKRCVSAGGMLLEGPSELWLSRVVLYSTVGKRGTDAPSSLSAS